MKRDKEKVYKPCFEIVADLGYEGYLMFTGSAGGDSPDAHFIKSVKVFDPTQEEKKSLYDYEAERDTVEYVRITEGHGSDLIHDRAPVESLSTEDLFTSINSGLRGQKGKYTYLSATLDHHISSAKKLYSELPKRQHIIPTLEVATKVTAGLDQIKSHVQVDTREIILKAEKDHRNLDRSVLERRHILNKKLMNQIGHFDATINYMKSNMDRNTVQDQYIQ